MRNFSPVILADADNTLWDTDAVFASAQLKMLASIDPRFNNAPFDGAIAYVRRYDQALARYDHRHLRYPPAMLAKALALGTCGVDPILAARKIVAAAIDSPLKGDEIDEALALYDDALCDIPKLLPGVLEGLRVAKMAGSEVWIISEGGLERQHERARLLGIDDLVQGVNEVIKIPEQFARLRQRFSPAQIFVVGDQPDRDIIPAQMVGCIGVLVPSRFRPAWLTDQVWGAAVHVADKFNEAIEWIISHYAPTANIALK